MKNILILLTISCVLLSAAVCFLYQQEAELETKFQALKLQVDSLKFLYEQDKYFHDQINYLQEIGADEPLARLIFEKATKYNFEPKLIGRIIKQESNFDTLAMNKSGAKGLMQITSSTARLYNLDNSFDPVVNLDNGCKILAEKLARYKTLDKALASYHGGHIRAVKWGTAYNQGSTKKYVDNILRRN